MSPKVKTSLVLCGLGLIVILGLLVRELAGNPTPPQPKVDIGGAFSLVNQDGQNVTEADFAGKPILVFFGFTYCPDVCPLSLDLLGAALDKLAETAPETAARLQPVFISVDPARDTPAQMKDYLSYFHPSLTGLTGSRAQIDAVKKAFRVYAARAKDTDANGHYNVDHSSLFYLMDGDNRYLAHFTHNLTPTQLAAGLAAKLK